MNRQSAVRTGASEAASALVEAARSASWDAVQEAFARRGAVMRFGSDLQLTGADVTDDEATWDVLRVVRDEVAPTGILKVDWTRDGGSVSALYWSPDGVGLRRPVAVRRESIIPGSGRDERAARAARFADAVALRLGVPRSAVSAVRVDGAPAGAVLGLGGWYEEEMAWSAAAGARPIDLTGPLGPRGLCAAPAISENEMAVEVVGSKLRMRPPRLRSGAEARRFLIAAEDAVRAVGERLEIVGPRLDPTCGFERLAISSGALGARMETPATADWVARSGLLEALARAFEERDVQLRSAATRIEGDPFSGRPEALADFMEQIFASPALLRLYAPFAAVGRPDCGAPGAVVELAAALAVARNLLPPRGEVARLLGPQLERLGGAGAAVLDLSRYGAEATITAPTLSGGFDAGMQCELDLILAGFALRALDGESAGPDWPVLARPIDGLETPAQIGAGMAALNRSLGANGIDLGPGAISARLETRLPLLARREESDVIIEIRPLAMSGDSEAAVELRLYASPAPKVAIGPDTWAGAPRSRVEDEGVRMVVLDRVDGAFVVGVRAPLDGEEIGRFVVALRGIGAWRITVEPATGLASIEPCEAPEPDWAGRRRRDPLQPSTVDLRPGAAGRR